MKYNKIKILLPVFIFAFTSVCYGQLAVPDYSFMGSEITGFSIEPGYTAVNFDFHIPSHMNVYLEKQKSDLDLGGKGNYKASEPGAIYSNRSSASFSSLFIGAKAFRNNIVKMYLIGNYIDVIRSYEKFSKKLQRSKYVDETSLLYALSLYATGNHQEAVNILTDLAGNGGDFAEIAQDNLFVIADRTKDFDIMEQVAAKAPSLSVYSLGIWLKNLYAKNRYADVLNYLNKYSFYENQYPELRNLRVSSLYYLKKYNEASKLIDQVKGMVSYPLVVDAFIMEGDDKTAESLAKQMKDSAPRDILLAKIDITRSNFASASKGIQKINDDKQKLALLMYAVSTKFKEVPYDFLNGIHFKHKQENDYKNYYMGLKYLADKKNDKALNKLALVAFNKNLVTNSYFYKGMASFGLDRSRAEWNFNKYISDGDNDSKVMLSKFMLAQMYFLDKRNSDAFMLIDDCKTDYCTKLKAEIMLADSQFDKSLSMVKGMKDERASLIRAGAYYNLKKYGEALKELSSVKTKSPDSEYLRMMSLFKTGRPDDAEKILQNNVGDKRIMSAGVEQLILAGAGETALNYIDKSQDLTPEYRLERANLLLQAKRIPEAEKAFKSLIASNSYIYEAMDGLFNIARMNNKGQKFVADSMPYIEKSVTFDNKDLLVARFAAYALEDNNTNVTMGYVNYFTDNFKYSPYITDIQHTRAKLFQSLGNYDDCVSETDVLIGKGGVQAEDAKYLKAQCMEHIDKNQALKLYRTMFSEKDRFFQPAATRISILSDDIGEILNASRKMQRIAPDVYKKGAVRFLEKLGAEDVDKYKNSLWGMASMDTDAVRSVALWRIGKNFQDHKNFDEATRYFLKSYYLFPKEPYAVKDLLEVKKIYAAQGMKKEVAKVDSFFKKMNVPITKVVPKPIIKAVQPTPNPRIKSGIDEAEKNIADKRVTSNISDNKSSDNLTLDNQTILDNKIFMDNKTLNDNKTPDNLNILPELSDNKTVYDKNIDNKTSDNQSLINNKIPDNGTIDNKSIDNKTPDNGTINNKSQGNIDNSTKGEIINNKSDTENAGNDDKDMNNDNGDNDNSDMDNENTDNAGNDDKDMNNDNGDNDNSDMDNENTDNAGTDDKDMNNDNGDNDNSDMDNENTDNAGTDDKDMNNDNGDNDNSDMDNENTDNAGTDDKDMK